MDEAAIDLAGLETEQPKRNRSKKKKQAGQGQPSEEAAQALADTVTLSGNRALQASQANHANIACGLSSSHEAIDRIETDREQAVTQEDVLGQLSAALASGYNSSATLSTAEPLKQGSGWRVQSEEHT